MANSIPTLLSLIGPTNTLGRALSDFETSLAAVVVSKQSSDGKITVVANGLGRIVSISIDIAYFVSVVELAQSNVTLAQKIMPVANAALTAAMQQSSAKAVTFATGLALP